MVTIYKSWKLEKKSKRKDHDENWIVKTTIVGYVTSTLKYNLGVL